MMPYAANSPAGASSEELPSAPNTVLQQPQYDLHYQTKAIRLKCIRQDISKSISRTVISTGSQHMNRRKTLRRKVLTSRKSKLLQFTTQSGILNIELGSI